MTNLHGFIMLHRKILDWEWYSDTSVRSVFIHLLLTASFKNKNWHGQEIMPGQVITSYAHLADALSLGVRQIRTALDKLKKTGEICVTTTSQYSVITLVNWALYQTGEEKATSDRQAIDTRPPSDRQHRNNVNNVNNANKYTPEGRTQLSFQNQNNYDYEKIRKLARENIRRKLGKEV